MKSLIPYVVSVTILTLTGAGPACQLFSGGSDVLGSVANDPDEPQYNVSTPQQVDRTVPFSVGFYTNGGGCIRTSARTEVRVRENVVEIRPYDRRDPDSGCCLCDDLVMISHRADVAIDRAGPATIRIIGKNVVERSVLVN